MSTISVDYDVLNQRGSPAWFTDTFANIPTAGYVGRMFISKDTFAFYRDTGTGWDLIGGPGIGTLTGSGVVGQVSFFNGTQVITGNNNLFWDNVNSRLGINTTTPGAPLDIHGTGTQIQLNGTGVSNSYIAYQQAGASKWRVGNFFDGTLNTFGIYNNGLVTNALTISSTTNDFTINGNINTGVYAITSGLLFSTSTLSVSNSGSVTGTNGISSFSGNVANNGFTFAPNNSSFHRFIVPTSSSYDWTFPATTGTIALTSNLSSYLPLTGGTLTGNLTINPTNTGIIGLDVASNTTIIRSDNTEGFKRQLEIVMGSGTLVQLTAKGYGANYGTDLAFYTATTGGTNASPGIYITGTNNRVGIKTGTPAYDLDVTGTFGVSSTSFFGGNIGLGTITPTGLGTRALVVTNTSDYPEVIVERLSSGAGKYGMLVANAGEFLIRNYTTGINPFTITSVGNFGLGNSGSSSYKAVITGIGTTSSTYILRLENGGTFGKMELRDDGNINFAILAGTGSRAVIADASGNLSAPVSDISVKQNIKPIGYGLNEILKMNPIWFDFIDEYKNYGTNRQNGNIAQEMEAIIPEAVFVTPYNNKMGINYEQLHAVYIKAIQELNDKLIKNNIN